MKKNSIYSAIDTRVQQQKKCYWVLLDPDDFSIEKAGEIADEAGRCGVNAFLIGGSLLHTNHLDTFILHLKDRTNVPVILFPGDATQLSANADALLYLVLISGRNPANLIGEHVKAAPMIKEMGIEPISTAYMLVESGIVSSVEFMSNTRPLPRNKPMIAAAHALAAQYMGMKMIYLEAGSGAEQSVPKEMIAMVRKSTDATLIVGGGIRDADTAEEKLRAGADIIVTGNLLRQKDGVDQMKNIAAMVNNY
ncbi:MAG: geranylgeranylglyceryl/heptaprenylglyceryl phosphate synthase [Chitinivibrionales bacterium]|nr:geranylgeranylglyceryl/heptaprenylglyceryl phosphate synthase [Chitinivibrionales bacterium]